LYVQADASNQSRASLEVVSNVIAHRGNTGAGPRLRNWVGLLTSSNQLQKNSKKDDILSSSEYGQLLKDPDLLFHGIKWDFWKIPSILRQGILSWMAASYRNLALGLNCGVETDSGRSVSCARSPVHESAVGYDSGAFGLYIKAGIAFVIRGVSDGVPNNAHRIPGNAMVEREIDTRNIIGLIVSEEQLEKNISDINILEGGSLFTFHLRCQSLLEYLRQHDVEDSALRAEVQKRVDTDEERKRLEEQFNALIRRSAKFDIPLVDFLRAVLPPHMKLYNGRGFEIC
jgi:hypothetical protein